MRGRRKRPRRKSVAVKVVDETTILGRPRRGAKLKEEVWQTDGKVTKYNLAYVNFLICQQDHGRVLGFDNSHGYHHRHFMGTVAPYKFHTYESLAAHFHEQVAELWRKEDEENT